MKKIMLKNGGEVVVDDKHYDYLSQFEWQSKDSRGSRNGNKHAVRYVNVGGKRLTIYMHRLITEARFDQRVSHINNNGLDNRASNLQLRTQQSWTSRPSGYRGVFQKETNRWSAEIEYAGRKHTIGEKYSTPQDAARAYNEVALELFGEQAHLNTV